MLAILAAALLAASPAHDTVFTSDGGRVLGRVVEEGPQGVAVQLPDGTFRRLARREVVRIEYADGTVSKPAEPAPSPPAYTPPPAQAQPHPPPPAYGPPPYTPPPPPAYVPPPYRPHHAPPPAYASPPRGPGPLAPVYLSLSLGGAGFSGEAERDVDIGRVFGGQFTFGVEGGIRLNPNLAIGLYADGGVGDPGRELRDVCNANLRDCTASTGRFGVLLRATFQPAAPATPWVSLGTGVESSTVAVDGGTSEDLTYSGWEMLRLQGGVDFRSAGVVGVGLYAGVRLGRYGRVEDVNGSVQLGSDRATHTTIEGGVRFTLFP
jgi:hypothetical protein